MRVRSTIHMGRLQTFSVAVLLLLLLSGCVNPFNSDNDSRRNGRANRVETTSVVLSFDTVAALTVAPDIANLASFVSSFEAVLQSATYGTITVANYTSGTPITDVPADGNWNITVNGRNNLGDLVAVGEPTAPGANPIDLSGQAGSTVAVTVELQPRNSGADGSLALNLDYSAAVTGDVTVDAIDIALEEQAGGTVETVTATGPTGQVTESFTDPGISDSAQVEVDFDARLMQITDADMPSGDYVITITFYEGTEPYAPITRAVQVYDYLDSNIDSASGTGTITLAAGDLTSAPDTPTGLVIEVTGDNLFDLYWSDASNTEVGYRVYAFDATSPGSVEQIGADLPANTQQFTGASPSFGNIDELTVEVVSYNRFGESAPLSVEFRSLPAAQFPDFNPATSVNSNDASWIALSNPGNLEASTPIVGGADSMDLFISTADNLNDVFALPAPTATQGTLAYDLAGYGLAQGQTYYWRTQANSGTARIVYPVRTFTVRDGNLYVDPTGAPGAAGSLASPLDTVNAAITLAEIGETVQVAAGTYDEVVQVNKVITLEGVGDTTIIQNSTASADQDSMLITAAATVRNLQVVTGTGSTKAAINVTAPATIEGILITEDGAAATTIRGVSATGAQGMQFRYNRIRLAPGVAGSVGTRFGINLTNSDATPADPTIIAGNLIEFQTAADGIHVGLQPQDSDHVWMANNVLLQRNSANASFFTALRFNGAATGVRAIHNTVVNEDTDRPFTHIETSTGQAPTISNNIFFGSSPSDTLLSLSEDPLELHNNVVWNMASIGAGITDIEALNSLGYAQYNVEVDPVLEPAADYAPQVGSTPYRVRSGGKDLTDSGNAQDPGNFDFNGVARTNQTGVTVGAYELDDTRGLGKLIVAGNNGSFNGLISGDLVDDGSGFLLQNIVEVIPEGAPGFELASLRDVEALSPGASNPVYWVTEGAGQEEFLLEADFTVPGSGITTLYDLTFGANGSTGNTLDQVISFQPYNGGLDFVFADLNAGVYRYNGAAVQFISIDTPGGLRGGVATNGTTLWYDQLDGASNRVLAENSALDGTGGETNTEIFGPGTSRVRDMEVNSAGNIVYSLFVDGGAGRIIADDPSTANDADSWIVRDVTSAAQELTLDESRQLIYWSDNGTNVHLLFTDGFWGGTSDTVYSVTGGNGAFDLVP